MFKATVTDQDAFDTDSLCVETQPIQVTFTNTEIACGTGVTQNTTASVTITPLVIGIKYHWQARSKDDRGLYSSWASFGANSDTITAASDVEIDASQSGTVPLAIPVDPELTLIVTSVASALSCGDVTTTVTSAANAVPLGHTSLTTAHPIGGQSLNIKTNAASGYTVYISYGAAMLGASSGHTFANMGGTNASPTAWPANGTEAFGYTTESSSLSGTPARFHSPAKWAALTTTTGQEIMRNAATPGTNGDTNCIAYQGSVAGNTPADAAYSTTVLYAAVPLF